MVTTESSHWPRHLAIGVICLAILGASVGYAWATCEWSWVTRSGTLMVAVGVFWESWPILKTRHVGDLPFYGSQAAHTAVQVAVIIVCAGTLVQGYGDFLSHLLPACQ